MSTTPRRLPRSSHVLRYGPLLPMIAAVTFAAVELTSAPTATSQASTYPPSGPELYATHCVSCHGVDGAGVEGRGPSLLGEGEAATDFVLRTGRMPLAAPDLQARRGPVRFDEDEIDALVAFVSEIGDGPATPDTDIARGDIASGGQLYRLNCAACHVTSGAGAPIGGGRIAPDLMETTPTQVGQAIVVGPGSMPVFASFDQQRHRRRRRLHRRTPAPGHHRARADSAVRVPQQRGSRSWILVLIPLVAITRWLGRPKDGRDRPLEQLDEAVDG